MSNLWKNISGIKQIDYQAKKISILSLFVSIRFEIDQIVHGLPNIVVANFSSKIQERDLRDDVERPDDDFRPSSVGRRQRARRNRIKLFFAVLDGAAEIS